MTFDRASRLASGIVLFTGAAWGLYWLPVRELEARGLPGAWGTLAITLAAVAVLVPVVLARRGLAGADRLAVLSVALGGAAFALYSIGFVYGRVAMVILLWFLSPVWATLIGRLVMGWPTPRMRLWAIAAGLAGLGLILGADGGLPLPQGLGEWLSLAGGVLWAVSTTGIRVRPALGPGAAALVFAAGAALATLALAPLLAPLPRPAAPDLPALAGLALAAGGLWWGVLMAALLWAAARLEPARVSILLMTEVLVGAISAALIAGERLQPPEILGGALVLVAGVLEVWPARRGAGR